MRLSRTLYKTEKVDLLLYAEAPAWLGELIEFGRDALPAVPPWLTLSLRTDAVHPPPAQEVFEALKLHDVFLCPAGSDAPHLETWVDACRKADVPLRVQWTPPFAGDFDPEALADRMASWGAVAVNVGLSDPFSRAPLSPLPDNSVGSMNALAAAVDARGIESNLYGLPFCHVTEENRVRAGNSPQFFLDHQQYVEGAYDTARRLYGRKPRAAGRAIALMLARNQTWWNPLDDWFSKILYVYLPVLNRGVNYLRRYTRHIHHPASTPKELKPLEAPVAASRPRAAGPECARCRWVRICDGITPEVSRLLPALAPQAEPGEVIRHPLHFSLNQRKHYDSVDARRRRLGEELEELAREAKAIVTNRPPDQRIRSGEYGAERPYCECMSGAVRWHSISNTERLSNGHGPYTPPVTFAVSLGGGGMADSVGFAFWGGARILCPMVAPSHELILHIAADGRYVLLRDGHPLYPAEFSGPYFAPLRLGSLLPMRLALWNIDGNIMTQEIHVWKGDHTGLPDPDRVRYSILIVSTRFSRRLQATLQSIAHQRGIELDRLEVIVAYVPGLDATDDVIDSFRAAHPELRILRSPFPPDRTRSKGYMINESLKSAAGEWIVLLDSDILLPPDMFRQIDARRDEAVFMAPDGRHMLDAATTGRVLLGELTPWNDWDALVAQAPEYRAREALGVPIGFCQVVKASCFERVRYREYEHFEGADYDFGREMRKVFGDELRLEGTPVLHMDHGGSQWVGTVKHY